VADCDGDGVTNGDEATDGTDPQDPCSFLLASQTVTTSTEWDNLDCDGDGVTNSDEVNDGTDPLDPCSLVLESQTVPPSDAWALLDCDGDGNPNGGDPNPLLATAADDEGTTPALTEVVINILANDDYLPNNDPANVGTTSITRIGGNATGEVSFDPDTGELTYIPAASESNTSVTIIYQVCNIAPEPDVCASATVTISVGNDILDAVDDDYTGTPFYGVTGGVLTGLNVLDNDTFNGAPVVPATVAITSTPTGPLTINENGTITLAPGTDPGTYTIEYTICEVANPTNCDSATVTVEVTSEAPAIDAVDDSATTTASGGLVTGLNVLDNDILNGNPLNLADVVLTSTPTGPLTVNSDGTVTVAPDTAPGTYTIVYTICEVADPTNCDSATVIIEVTPVPPVIDAVDDETEVTPSEGLSGGIIPNFNVLDNDTLGGGPVDPADVVITSTPTGTLTINSDGTVNVSAETEAGTYSIEYTICEVTNPSNCDTALVTIVVTSPPLVDALDDRASVSAAEGITGGSISGLNIFDNDTLDGAPLDPSEVTLTSNPTGPLTINSDGSVSLASDTTEGTYTIQYTICEIANPDNCDTATVTVIVRSPANIIVLKVDTFNDENGDGYAQVGETISYAFTVINNGSVPLGNITVTDPLVTVSGGPLQILEPGESDSTTFTATYTITEEDLANGFFANSAFVSGFIPDNGPVGSLSDDPDDPTDVDTDGDGNPDDMTVTDLIESPLLEIDAVDDDYTAIAVDGTAGGLVPDSNVLDNDTLNGETLDPADVTITSTPTGPLTVNSDGTVSVAPGTSNGLYVIEYTICEVANSTNCDTATVTVLVTTPSDFKIEVNQMVTPNNDGRNDFLFIRDVDFAKNNTLRIYNRWGIAVYEGSNYNNQNNVFDGRSRGRSTLSVQDYLPAGVYFYIFEYDLNEERITDSGYLYLSK